MKEKIIHVDAPNFCAGAIVQGNKIVEAAPILKKFIGQPPSNLTYWCFKNGFKFTVT